MGSDGQEIHGNTEETFLDAGGSQRNIGLFLQDRIEVSDRFSLLVGNRFDNWRNYNGHSGDADFASRIQNSWSPRASATLKLTSKTQFHGSWYRSFRAPTLNELYRSFQLGSIFTQANPALRAETLTGTEAGITWKVGRTEVTSNVFRMMLHDAIGNTTLSTSPQILRQRQNVGEILSTGFEFQIGMQVFNRWRLDAGYQFANSIVENSKYSPALVGNNTPQVPKNMAVLSSQTQVTRSISFSMMIRFTGKQYEDDLNLLPLRPFTAFDAQIRYRINSLLSAFINTQNLFNNRYELGRIPYPTYGSPRLVEFGISLIRD